MPKSRKKPVVKLGARFLSAFLFAAEKHAGQARKASTIPYISHLMGVASLVLIDGDLAQSVPQIAAHIRALGFRLEDVKLILNSHVHCDHAGGIFGRPSLGYNARAQPHPSRLRCARPASRLLRRRGIRVKFFEINLFGVYVAPISVMMVAAWIVTAASRRVADRFGLLRYVWHPALFVFAVYIIVLSSMVLVIAH